MFSRYKTRKALLLKKRFSKHPLSFCAYPFNARMTLAKTKAGQEKPHHHYNVGTTSGD
jgi:hypothetical protein